MTRHEMARGHLAEARHFPGTDVHGMRTPRVKFTALWRCEHITHRPRDRRQIFGLGIQTRDRIEETNCIWVQRMSKKLVFGPELNQKRLELLSELAADARLVAVLVNPTNPTMPRSVEKLPAREQEVARSKKLEFRIVSASTEVEIDTAFQTMAEKLMKINPRSMIFDDHRPGVGLENGSLLEFGQLLDRSIHVPQDGGVLRQILGTIPDIIFKSK